MKPFYLLVVLWGNKFCHYFLDLLIVSLLADNNLPAIAHKAEHVFLIATTKEDWFFLQSDARFKLLSQLITIKFLDIGAHLVHLHKGKMHIMSLGHKEVAHLAYENRGIGVFLTPDMVLTESALVTLEKILRRSYQVVLCPAVRFEYDGCMREFKQKGFLSDGKLTVTGQELMSVVLANVHSETETWMWDGNCYADNPVITLKHLTGKNNYVLHGYSWAPLAIDYSSLSKHDVSTFEKSTLDQDYIYKNFGQSEKIYVVMDTDELALASFSTEEEYHIPTLPKPLQHFPYLGRAVRLDNLSRIHHCKIHDMDPLKSDLVKLSVLMHAEPAKPEWKDEIQAFRKQVMRAINNNPVSQYPAHIIYSKLRAVLPKEFYRWTTFLKEKLLYEILCYQQWYSMILRLKKIRQMGSYLVKGGFRDAAKISINLTVALASLLIKIVLRVCVAVLFLVIIVYAVLSFFVLVNTYHVFRLCYKKSHQFKKLDHALFPNLRIDIPPQPPEVPSKALILFGYVPRYLLWRTMDICHSWYHSFKGVLTAVIQR